MRRATQAAEKGAWPEAEAVGAVTLDFDARHRRRVRLETDRAGPVLLDLERATALGHGDGLRLEDGGGWIEVRAADEALVEIRAADPVDLPRIAWHLGNRHCPAELHPDRLYIRRDHVIEAMLRGLGATVSPVSRPFDPERGAYHDHENGHGHDG